MTRRLAYFVAFLLLGTPLGAATKEVPVGLLLTAGGSVLVRANTETAVAARSADILFPGDAIRAGSAPASFLFCPGQTSQTLTPGTEVLLGQNQLKVKSGRLSDQRTVASCFLPQVVRVAVASQQHYGISMTRGAVDAVPVSIDKLPPALVAELAPLDKALAGNPQDIAALVARAALFEKYKLPANALAEYRKIAAQAMDAIWVRQQIFELQEELAAAAADSAAKATEGGQTYALIVGISKYQKLPQDLWLQYANADASDFAKHLASPRGGAVPASNIVLLTDEKATTAAIRSAFQMFLKVRAGKKDSIFILIAGHGTVEPAGSRGAYIITNDSDPQDLASTALPMADVQNLFQTELTKVGRVAVFVDVCHSGAIGAIRSMAINGAVERLAEAEGDLLGFLSSRPKELSYEGPQYGGGHGAFTYYLLKGLNGAADKNGDGVVDVNEILAYVRDQVAQGTGDKQHPRDFGNADNNVPLADTRKPGIQIAGSGLMLDSKGRPVYLASAVPYLPAESLALQRFTSSLSAGRILPGEPNSAFAALSELKSEMAREEYLRHESMLRTALEERGQQVLLRYLAGEEVPQTRTDFASAAGYVEAARRLTPESLYLEGRDYFFQGRTFLFDKEYARAADLLERSVAIDPNGAYAYNALGIAYLEQADFGRAAAAFRDAVRRAPYWAYPLHNLALTDVETGDYEAAIRRYRQAMKLAPRAGYLQYNLGLLYQRLNRRREAEAAYRKAMALAPDAADPLNALGSLKAGSGKTAEAERLYRSALQKDPGLLAARHNLAQLLWQLKGRQEEAIGAWQANLARATDYLPSRLSLAEALAGRQDIPAAIREYRVILNLRPEYAAARLALAALLEKARDPQAAVAELRQVLKADPRNPTVLERIGDAERAAGNSAAAVDAYRAALEQAKESGMRKRLRRKLGPG